MAGQIDRPLFVGTHPVKALWFDLELTGPTIARQRVLAHWQHGSRLYGLEQGYLLVWPKPIWCHCQQLDALPLLEQDGVLSSAPLNVGERQQAVTANLWLVRGGQLTQYVQQQLPVLQPSDWIDLSAIALHQPLRAPVQELEIPVPASDKPLRAILGGKIPPASDKLKQFLQDAAKQDPAQKKHHEASRGNGAGKGLVADSIGSLAGWFGAKLADRASRAAQPSGQSSALAKKLHQWAEKMSMLSGVSKIMGKQHARFLSQMLDMFEKGDLLEALKHAIPLGDNSPGGQDTAALLGRLSARRSLNISGPHGTAGGVSVEDDLMAHLRKTYRRTFEKLDREGKIDEATFVLAELLGCGAEAASYLESKGRLQQAAELAQTLHLSPEIAIRLWCLQGNLERAMELAQLFNAYAATVLLLEKDQPEQARLMRLSWAKHLGARGELTEAVEVIWPLQDQRQQACLWLQQAEQASGSLGLRALVRKLFLMPETLGQSLTRLDAILAQDDADGVLQRYRLAVELLASKQDESDATQRVAQELLRRVLAERHAGLNQLTSAEIHALAGLANNALLRADLPPVRNVDYSGNVRQLVQQPKPLQIKLAEPGIGTIHDACLLPDQDYLLAMGEGGVVRIDRSGRTLAHFPVPAHKLVLAHGGQRALALGRREQRWRVSRLDLTRRSVSDWLTLPLAFWGQEFDGVLWNVVMDNRLMVLDTSSDQLRVTWQIADLPGQIVDYHEDRHHQLLLMVGPEGNQVWRYQLPARRLMQRKQQAALDENSLGFLLTSMSGDPLCLTMRSNDQGGLLYLDNPEGNTSKSIALGEEAQQTRFASGSNWIGILMQQQGHSRCLLADIGTRTMRAELLLEHCNQASMRFQDGHFLLFDQQGRLMDLSWQDSLVHTVCLRQGG